MNTAIIPATELKGLYYFTLSMKNIESAVICGKDFPNIGDTKPTLVGFISFCRKVYADKNVTIVKRIKR